MNNKQAVLRFAHPCGVRSSSQWRNAMKSSKSLAGVDLDAYAIFQSSTALSIYAMSPKASIELDSRVMDFMRGAADAAGRVMDVEKIDLTPSASFMPFRWEYRVPKLIVAKPAKTKAQNDLWTEWRKDAPDQQLIHKLTDGINQSLQNQLAGWLDVRPDLEIKIESIGTPMVIKGAIATSNTPVSALARLDVVFSSSCKLNGAFFVGNLNVTGFGRVFREGYLESSEETSAE